MIDPNRIRDRLWIRQSFTLEEGRIDDVDMRRRQLSTASFKFTDTTLGGNFAINAPPSYCRFADPRMGGKTDNGRGIAFMRSTGRLRATANNMRDYEDIIGYQNTSPSSGMGEYYSEAIDDNNQIVTMRFGVPAYNGLFTFFGQFYDPKASAFAKTGRISDGIVKSIFVGAAETAGNLLGTMLALPLQPFVVGGSIIRKLSGMPPSKFYYLKPAMFPYWNAVQTIVNSIGVNIGLVPQSLTPSQKKITGELVDNFAVGNFAVYAQQLPDIISPSGFIDVFAMATKAQRRANLYNTNLISMLDTQINTTSDLDSAVNAFRKQAANFQNSIGAQMTQAPTAKTFSSYLSDYLSLEWFRPTAQTGVDTPIGEDNESIKNSEAVEPIGNRSQYNWMGNLFDFYKGELRDGGSFVSFRVDYTGTHSESFSNEVGESGVSQKFNSTAASNRMARFDLSDGNTGIGLVDGIIEAAKAATTGIINGLQISGVAALAGSAFVDIPLVWQNATANLPTASFTMELRSPYNNNLSRMQNLFIPLAMILAGALPLAAGKKAYTQPFLVEMYCKGRANIRLGIIDSLTIERGAGNTGWDNEGNVLGINISFTVKDLSTIMAMPVTTEMSVWEKGLALVGNTLDVDLTGLAKSSWDEDNVFTDYMATLGSLGFSELVYTTRAYRLNRLRLQRQFEKMKSPAYWASGFNGTIPGRILNAIALETDRR